jgi:hypothetical protein
MNVTNATSAFVSWNGATEVTEWRLYGSDDASSTTPIANSTKTGFETALDLSSSSKTYKYYQVAGVDAQGSSLGWSDFVAVDGSIKPPTQEQGDKVTVTGASGTGGAAAVNTDSTTANTPKASDGAQSATSSASTVETSGLRVAFSAILFAMMAVLA